MGELKKQKEFFEFITEKSVTIQFPKSGVYIYRQLVFYRFFETLKHAYPLLHRFIGEERFQELVRLFIKSKPASSLIWKSAYEFKFFLLKSKLLSEIPPAKAIVPYELAELDLIMGNYSKVHQTTFEWKNIYKISPSTRLLKLSYPVQRNDFLNKHKQFLILYYDFSDHKVYYIESSKFMFSFFKSPRGISAHEALEKICTEYNLDLTETKKILEPVLTSYCSKKILVAI